MKSISVVCIWLLLSTVLFAEDWPGFRGAKRDGVSTETGLATSWKPDGPPLLWTMKTAGVGYSGPAVVGNRLYSCGGRGDGDFLFAWELPSGHGEPKELWSVRIGPLFQWKGNSWNEGPNVSPTVDGDKIYALGGMGDLLCAEAASGKEIWRVNLPKALDGEVNPIGGGLEEPTPLGWGYAHAPLIDGDKLICVPGGKKGLVAALDKKTGKLLWQSAEVTDQAPYASPMVAEIEGKKQYVLPVNAGIVGISAVDGKLLWRYQREPAYDDGVIATPIVQGNVIFASVGFGQGCDLIKVNGGKVEKVLSSKIVQNRDGGMVCLQGHVYCHSENRGWLCMELATGKILWAERNKLARGSVTAVDKHLICLGEEGTVVLLEASTQGWKEQGRFTLPGESKKRKPSGAVWTNPVIANGKLYLRDQELVYCYDLK